MPYVTSVERLAKEEGRKEGRKKGREEGAMESLVETIQAGLEDKFGAAGLKLMPRIRALKDLHALRTLARTLITAERLDAIRDRLK